MTPPAVWKRSRLPGTWSCRLQESAGDARLMAPEAAIVSRRRSANCSMSLSPVCTSRQTFDGPEGVDAGPGAVAGPCGGTCFAGPAAKQGADSAARAVSSASPRNRFIVTPIFGGKSIDDSGQRGFRSEDLRAAQADSPGGKGQHEAGDDTPA